MAKNEAERNRAVTDGMLINRVYSAENGVRKPTNEQRQKIKALMQEAFERIGDDRMKVIPHTGHAYCTYMTQGTVEYVQTLVQMISDVAHEKNGSERRSA